MSSQSKGYGGKDGPPVLTVRKPLVNKEWDWRKDAECIKDKYVNVSFFPPMEQTEKVEQAKNVCRKCPVHADCLKFAVENEIQFGIWGGLIPSERENVEQSSDPR